MSRAVVKYLSHPPAATFMPPSPLCDCALSAAHHLCLDLKVEFLCVCVYRRFSTSHSQTKPQQKSAVYFTYYLQFNSIQTTPKFSFCISIVGNETPSNNQHAKPFTFSFSELCSVPAVTERVDRRCFLC